MPALRASSYNIYINLPDTNDETLIVHGYTGAYDRVSKRVSDYVKSLQSEKAENPLWGKWVDESPKVVRDGSFSPSERTLEILRQRGYLTQQNVEDERKTFISLAKALHAAQNNPHYIFMPTYNCNLRCAYCFQHHMRTDSAHSHLLRAMQPEMADRIFRAMGKIEKHYGVAEQEGFERSIGFFGGEPLMRENYSIVEYIVRKALQGGKASLWAVSNATDLDAFKDLLSPEKISFLQITLDGPATEHDTRRIYANGEGSFERIARNITMALDLGVVISVRMNIDRNNINHLPALGDEIVKRGWNAYKNFSTYASPVIAVNENVSKPTTFNSWQLDQAVEALRGTHPNMKVIGHPGDAMKERTRRLFVKNALPSLNATGCGAHTGMYIFDAFGDIYACWERTGDSKIRIGSLTADDDVLLNEEINTMWRSRNVTTNPTCLKCRYALHCGGGCAVHAEAQHGTIFSNFCDAFGKRFNAAVAEAYLEHVGGVQYVEKAERGCDL